MKIKILVILISIFLIAAAVTVSAYNKEILNKNYKIFNDNTKTSFEKNTISKIFSGEIDIAVTLADNNLVNIFKGDGSGGFSYFSNSTVGEFPLALTGGDYNKDGCFDLVSSNFDNFTITLLLGDGTGLFTPYGYYETEEIPFNIITEDFNDDANLDVAVVNYQNDSFSVFFGDGMGGFSTQQVFTTGDSPIALTSGDYDGDGNIDLIVATENDMTISVFLGDGSGIFALYGTHYLGLEYHPFSIQKADFNNDQKLDVVVGSGYYPFVGVMLGDGAGGFGSLHNFTTGNSGERFTIATDDFNKDGNEDIAVPNTDDNTISVLLGDGTGSFSPHQVYSVGDYPVCIASADFNSDDNSDLVVSNAFEGTVTVYLGDGVGGFGSQNNFIAGNVPVGLVVADFDFIANPDLDCDGDLSWTEVKPGDTVYGAISVNNVGDAGSYLDWEIQSYPDWGTWTFDPDSGIDLLAGDSVTIDVEIIAPDEPDTEFTGDVILVNSEDPTDTCTIEASLATPQNQMQSNQQILIRFLQNHPNMFLLLQRLLGL